MRSKLALLTVGVALAGCTAHDQPAAGLSAVNVPVVTNTQYVFDAAAPDGSLGGGEAERLNGWFQSLGLGYGDAIYLDGDYNGGARAQVAQVAGRYGLLVQSGAPVTAGGVQPGTVRVVVSRRRAEVPNCPNWSSPSQPNYENRTMSNFGCSVNGNLAAMVADPVDLIHGRDGGGVANVDTTVKAIDVYRKTAPSGTKGLQNLNTKGN